MASFLCLAVFEPNWVVVVFGNEHIMLPSSIPSLDGAPAWPKVARQCCKAFNLKQVVH